MSGSQIKLVGNVDGMATRLVGATARLAAAGLGPHALVGGLAVMCRLVKVHRVTTDIDTVTETTTPTAIELITSSIGSSDPTNRARVFIDGVRVDIIETEAFDDEDLEGIEGVDRLFVVAHRWALETAEPAEIVVAGSEDVATIRVATPAALVAMKTSALAARRPREPRKHASDLYDLYSLTVEHDREGRLAEALSAAPYGLGAQVGAHLQQAVVDNAERAARWLSDGGTEMGAITADDIRDVLGPLVDRLSR